MMSKDHVEAIVRNVHRVRARMADACRRSGRSPDEVVLVAVSKAFPVLAVRAAIEAGVRHFGENRTRDLIQKSKVMPGRHLGGVIEWHMIGHLQRNKAKDVVRCADRFQALDSLRLAQALNEQARRVGRTMPCLVQVNISGDPGRFGVDPDSVEEMLGHLQAYEYVEVEGLMAMASFSRNPEDVRPEFRRMHRLFDRCGAEANGAMTQLSMGMSGDFEVAIEEGATHVRIGSGIFGARSG